MGASLLSAMSGAEEWSVGARFGLGIGISVVTCIFALLAPPVRRYLAYEWESSHISSNGRLLMLARALAWISFTIQVGALTNQFAAAGNDAFQCVEPGCGKAKWELIDGSQTEKMSNYLIFNGCFYQLAVMLVQQALFWVPPVLRGQSIFYCLLSLVLIEYLGWYVPYIFGYGPFEYM